MGLPLCECSTELDILDLHRNRKHSLAVGRNTGLLPDRKTAPLNTDIQECPSVVSAVLHVRYSRRNMQDQNSEDYLSDIEEYYQQVQEMLENRVP